MVDDGAGQEVRKKSDEKRIVENTVFFGSPLIGVHQIGNLGKGKEADAERQYNMSKVEVKSTEVIYIGN
jgi:hypothetical protein